MKLLYYLLLFLISYISILSKDREESCYLDFSNKKYENIGGKYILKYYDL